jgi:hypothetical protein
MKKVLMVLALLGFVAASAQAMDLSNGLFLAHNPPEILYSFDAPVDGWCAEYMMYQVNDLAQIVPNHEGEFVDGFELGLFYVLAAWEVGPKVWRGVQFGLGDYDGTKFAIIDPLACYPGEGLEIPGTGWPGPNTGTALVVTDASWDGNYLPVYFFGGYMYYYGVPTDIPLTPHPDDGFGGFASDDVPPVEYQAYNDYGVFSIMGEGHVGEFPGAPVGACCLDEFTCVDGTYEADCIDQGGRWMGAQSVCDEELCLLPHACCFPDGSCLDLLEADCMDIGGDWLGDMMCEPDNPCPQPTACCVPGPPHMCYIVYSEQDCMDMQGIWLPDVSECEDDTCDPYTPAENTSWGTIKSMYR